MSTHPGGRIGVGPMTWIQLLTEEPALLAVVQRLAPSAVPVRITDSVGPRGATPPVAVVVATAGNHIPFVLRAMDDADAAGLHSRTVVLAPFSRALASALVRRSCPHLVWLDDVRRELGSVLRRMVESDIRFLISEALLDHCGDDPLLRRTVQQAFEGGACPTTVSELAARAHSTPSTLRTHWRQSGLPDSPQALVEWAVLVAVAELRREGSKMSTVSRLIGLHETTLYRAARRRAGVPPSRVDRDALLTAIGEWIPKQAG